MAKPTFSAALAMLLCGAQVSCALVGGHSADAIPAIALPGRDVWVARRVDDEPARAAVARFLPALSGHQDFEDLVSRALDEAITNRLHERAAATPREMADIREAIVLAGLPDVMIGIPYVESRLRTGAVSPQCAAGPWQFLPEVAVAEGLRIKSCTVVGREDPWSPGRYLPSRDNRVYLGRSSCLMRGCVVDERLDLEASTDAAVGYLADLMHDPVLGPRPDRDALAIMAYNAGPGGIRRFLDNIGSTEDPTIDPFDVAPSCATGDCLVLSNETAWYLPRVVAAAAIAACNGADAGDARTSDLARSDLCRSLAVDGYAPEPPSAMDALALAAMRTEHWRIGLQSTSGGTSGDRAALDGALASSVASVPSIEVILGVPGEEAVDLFASGADVVLVPTVGRVGDRVWIRLESVRAEGLPGPAAFEVVESTSIDSDAAASLVADSLLRPVREHQESAIGDLVASRREILDACLPPVVSGWPEALASVSVNIDATGRANALTIQPSGLEPEVEACLSERLAAVQFPPELSGAATVLDFGRRSPEVVDSE